MTDAPLRVVVVEAAGAGRALRRALEAGGEIRVVATAATAAAAATAVAAEQPDAVLVDLDAPDAAGHAAVVRIMQETPSPILVLGRPTREQPLPAAAALAAGAVDALPHPAAWTADRAAQLRRSVRRVAAIPVIRRRARPAPPLERRRPPLRDGLPVVAVAASTGGPPALTKLLRGLAGLPAPILVVQHIHPSFAAGFAAWLASTTGRDAALARDGDRLEAGRVHVAPGGRHLRVAPGHRLELSDQPESLHRPSADVLFYSVADHMGSLGVGVLLTGMGDDGAAGLRAIRQAGGHTLAQDESSSAVYGMPRAAAELGAVSRVLPLDELPGAIRDAVQVRR